MAAVFALLSVGLWTEAGWAMPAVLVTAVMTTPLILLIVTKDPLAQQPTPRVARPGDPESPDDDALWKWGFYVNPADPRVLVDKRMGIGGMLNVGHPVGRLIVIAFVAVVLLCGALPLLGWHGG